MITTVLAAAAVDIAITPPNPEVVNISTNKSSVLAVPAATAPPWKIRN